MLIFAYDATLNGDWVAHYAVHFAATSPGRRLLLLHVPTPETAGRIAGRIARIEEECRFLSVEFSAEVLETGGTDRDSVAGRLLARLREEMNCTVIAGARARPRRLAFLAGTVTARLFAAAPGQVVAIRVVNPGVLGYPGRLLLPLAGHPRGAGGALPLLRLFGADLHHLHLLHVRVLSRLRFRLLGTKSAQRLLADGQRFVTAVEKELAAGLAPVQPRIDATVVVSDDATKEILAQAARSKARLICLGASERSLPHLLIYGNPIEQVLRDATCDVAVYGCRS